VGVRKSLLGRRGVETQQRGLLTFPGVNPQWLQEANIVRVDRCQFSNLTDDPTPPERNTSLLRVHQPFFWAWHGGECNGLRDGKWVESGGAELIGALRADAVRLLRLGVLTASQRAAGSVAIDIGAHSGDSTLPMAMLANRTIAFDPNTDVFNILRVNAKINPHLHIDAHPLAIADADKVASFSSVCRMNTRNVSLCSLFFQNLTFQYGWRVPANAQSEFRCNGGVSGVGGRTLPQLWVTKRAVQLEGFLRRSYGDDIVPRVKYIKIDAEVRVGGVRESCCFPQPPPFPASPGLRFVHSEVAVRPHRRQPASHPGALPCVCDGGATKNPL